MQGLVAERCLVSEKEALQAVKGNISNIYKKMGHIIANTSEHMGEFRKMIQPYVNYFYSGESEQPDGSFIADVVAPSRLELDAAIDRAVQIMTGDVKMNENVSRVIEDVLGLKDSIDQILGLIDEIDIYSENTLIISTKYGAEGMSLARISNEMVMMAQRVHNIGDKFRDYLDRLGLAREDFNRIHRTLEVISENYLTRMKLEITTEFDTMIYELNSVSNLVQGMLSGSGEVETSMKDFINNIQMEDIIRQKIEKIMFYLDELGKRDGRNEANEIEDLEAVVLHVVSDQLSDLNGDLSWQRDEAQGLCSRLSMTLNGILSKFYASDERDEQNRMDAIYNRIEDFKKEYITKMEEIISNKKRILDICRSIIETLTMFDGLFNGISGTVKKFEALNMITRIELARHKELSRTLGGTLVSVKTLPAKMKQIVKQSQDLYHGIQESIADAVAQYAGNFNLQQQVIGDCIASIKKVSIKLYESQKYYWDISQEIGRYCQKVREFTDSDNRLSFLFEAMDAIRDVIAGVNAFRENESEAHRLDVETVRQRINRAAEAGHLSPGSVMDALIRDFQSEKSKDHVIIF